MKTFAFSSPFGIAIVRIDGNKDEAIEMLRIYEENRPQLSNFHKVAEIDDTTTGVIAYFYDSTL
jgi:hypothetical protein